MKSTIVRVVLGGLVVSLCALPACSDDDELPAVNAEQASAECSVVGELCHHAETEQGQDCHERAHGSRGAACHELFSGCVKTCVPAAAERDADAHCAALADLCGVVDDDDGPLHACAELGRANDGAACEGEFVDCVARCSTAREALEELPAAGGAGGGGAAGSAGGAAGSAGGAAGSAGGAAGSAGGAAGGAGEAAGGQGGSFSGPP